MEAAGRYRAWARQYPQTGKLSSLFDFFMLLPFLNLPQRKALLTMSRCQVAPYNGTKLRERLEDTWCSAIEHDLHFVNNGSSLRLTDLAFRVAPFLKPHLTGLLSVAIRMAPYRDYTTVAAERDKTIYKELAAAVEIKETGILDYDAILSNDKEERHRTRFAYNLPMDSRVQDSIHYGIKRGRSIIDRNRKPLYPRYTKKYVSRESRGNMHDTYPGYQQDVYYPESSKDAIRIYYLTGLMCTGDTEAGSAWKYNDLKPRLFYRMGLRDFWPSMYIQYIFTTLVDQFDSSHTRTRYFTHSMKTSAGDTVFIYDYSAFTSTLVEIKEFTRRLGQAFKGTLVTVVDPVRGIVNVDLGEMILEYNDICNVESRFNAEEVLEFAELVLNHNAGMLGVPGNISSSTLLHAIHLMIVLQSLERCRVVGDDAIGSYMEEQYEEESLQTVLQNIGVMNPDKMETWVLKVQSEGNAEMRETWNYIKRPISHVDERPTFGWMVDWPSLANCLDLRDNHHTVMPSTPSQRYKTFAKQTRRMVEELESHGTLSDEEWFELSNMLRPFYHGIGLDNVGMPRKDSSIAETDGVIVPPLPLSGNWKLCWKENNSMRMIRVPVLFDRSKHILPYEEVLPGRVFFDRGRPHWKFARDVGVCESEMVTEMVSVGRWPLIDEYLSKSLPASLYKYDIRSAPTKWLEDEILQTYLPPIDPFSDPSEVIVTGSDLDLESDTDMSTSDSDSE